MRRNPNSKDPFTSASDYTEQSTAEGMSIKVENVFTCNKPQVIIPLDQFHDPLTRGEFRVC